MLAISPYPYMRLELQIDTLRTLTDSSLHMLLAQSAKMDSICDATFRLSDRQEALYGGMDTLQTGLQVLSEQGIGFNDVISVISVPLILMLFAFAFPFIFDSINHINSKYKSKVLSNLFEKHLTYKYFWWATYFSLGYVFILGGIFLLLPSEYQQNCSRIASWCSLCVALGYSLAVVLFIRYCVKYNKAESVVTYIEKAYRREKRKRPSTWKRLRHRVMEWRHRKDTEWLKVYRHSISFSGVWDDYSPREVYKLRLIALCKYSLREHDVALFYNVMEGVDKIIEVEKQGISKLFGKDEGDLSEGAIHYNTRDFFKEVFAVYSTCQQDGQIEETLIWKLLYAYNRARFINVVDVLFLAQTLFGLSENGQQLLLEKYIDRARYYYSYIPELPRILYVKGCQPKNLPSVESKSRSNWEEICNYHFLAFAYALCHGMYSLLNKLQNVKFIHDHNLIPVTTPDVLVRYAKCLGEMKMTDYFGHCRTDEIFGKSVNIQEITENYAVMLFLLSANKETYMTEMPAQEDLANLQNNKERFVKKANSMKQDARLLEQFERVKDVDVEILYDKTVKHIAEFLGGPLTKNKKGKQKNWYKEPVGQEQKEAFEKQFEGISSDVERYLPKQYKGCTGRVKSETIDINECALVIEKRHFILADGNMMRGLYIEYLDAIKNRIIYAMLSAYQKMTIKDVSVTPADFGHFIDGYTQNHPEDYLMVEVDSHILGWLSLTYEVDYRKSYKGIPFLSIDSVGGYSYLADLPAYDHFKNSIVLIKKIDQPVLKDKEEGASIKFNYMDESSEQCRKLALRVGVDVKKELTFDPDDSIVRIRTKKITV